MVFVEDRRGDDLRVGVGGRAQRAQTLSGAQRRALLQRSIRGVEVDDLEPRGARAGQPRDPSGEEAIEALTVGPGLNRELPGGLNRIGARAREVVAGRRPRRVGQNFTVRPPVNLPGALSTRTEIVLLPPRVTRPLPRFSPPL